jgi:hypothetical protein
MITAISIILFCALAFAAKVILQMRTERNYQMSVNAKYRKESEDTIGGLRTTLSQLTSDLDSVKTSYSTYKTENEKYQPKIRAFKTLEIIESNIKEAGQRAEVKKAELALITSQVEVGAEYKELFESGFYNYRYEYEDVLQYKEALQILKQRQRDMVQARSVVVCSVEALEGSALIKSLTKITMIALNNEIELIMGRLNSSNFDACVKKAVDHYDFLNEQLSPYNCKIDKQFLDLKVKELAVALEYELELEKIKAEQASLKEQMRDEEQAREEAEELREEAIVEEKKYEQLLETARHEAASASQEMQSEMQARIAQLEASLANAHAERERATSLAQVTKKGHIYIISNIGSFGENVFKIGLTRREDPMERVKELGDASVPFTFDVHAFIKAEDAPALEATLHAELNDHRINKVNARKEFFRVTLDTISETCKKLGCEVTLTQMAEARDYRATLKLLEDNDKVA